MAQVARQGRANLQFAVHVLLNRADHCESGSGHLGLIRPSRPCPLPNEHRPNPSRPSTASHNPEQTIISLHPNAPTLSAATSSSSLGTMRALCHSVMPTPLVSRSASRLRRLVHTTLRLTMPPVSLACACMRARWAGSSSWCSVRSHLR